MFQKLLVYYGYTRRLYISVFQTDTSYCPSDTCPGESPTYILQSVLKSFKRSAVACGSVCFVCDPLLGRHPRIFDSPCPAHLARFPLHVSARVRLQTVRQRSIQPERQKLHGCELGHRRRKRGKGDRGRLNAAETFLRYCFFGDTGNKTTNNVHVKCWYAGCLLWLCWRVG